VFRPPTQSRGQSIRIPLVYGEFLDYIRLLQGCERKPVKPGVVSTPMT